MPEEAVDFWPDLNSTKPRTPLLILKQQAALLGRHTKNLVVASVNTNTYNKRFFHRFIIEAQALNYQYELFRVSHDVILYPLKLESGPNGNQPIETFNSEDEFISWLKEVLNSGETKRVLNTLLAQVEA
jgi:hypothetical protein